MGLAWRDQAKTESLFCNKEASRRLPFEKYLAKAKTKKCIYTSLCINHNKYGKTYRLESFFKNFGVFKNSEHRRFFLYSFLDTCAYSRKCPKCFNNVNDILQHTLKDCVSNTQLRTTLRLKLLLWNASKYVNTETLLSKESCFVLAMINESFREAVCEYLINLGYYDPTKTIET